MTRLATAIARVQGIASTVVTGALLVIPLYAIRAQNANGTNPGTGSRIAITAPDSLSINFADTDLRLVVQALSPYLDHPLVFGNLPAARVSLQTPRPVAQSAVMQLLRGILDSQGLELILDPGANLYRVESRVVQQYRETVWGKVPVTPRVERLQVGRRSDQECIRFHDACDFGE